MHLSVAFLFGVTLAGVPIFGETTAPESQSMQSLLTEVHTLRQELRAAIVTAQRMQIVVYRLHVQQTAVARASQKMEEARGHLLHAEESKKSMAASLQEYEEQIAGTQDPNVRKALEVQVTRFKTMLDGWSAEIPKLQAKESEALIQLQSEQAKQTELQDSLDRLDKWLGSLP